MAKVEAIMTQLLFEHALRIRLKAEVSKETPGLEPAVSPAPEAAGRAESDAGGAGTTATSQSHNGEGSSPAPSEEVTLHSSSTSINSAHLKGKKEVMKGKAEEAKSKPINNEKRKENKKVSKNLVGKINNLATSDLKAISETSDVVRVCIMAPFQIVLCIWFLYIILGWRYDFDSLHLFSVSIITFHSNSAFVGFATMVALMPLPTLVAKYLRKIQSEAMKKKDARIQAVTESECPVVNTGFILTFPLQCWV
jgi:hypothetical protein